MGRHVLVVFYSRSGFTRIVAQAVARALGADLEELVDTKNRAGVMGYIRSVVDAVRRTPAQLRPLARDPAAYDVVVVGTPVWNAGVSTPVRTFLAHHKAALRKAAFFCTCGSRGSERAFRQMAEVCGKTPEATMSVRDREVGGAMQDARIHDLVARLPAAAARR